MNNNFPKIGPKQIKWIEDKFGHLKPNIKDNARITETSKSERPQ